MIKGKHQKADDQPKNIPQDGGVDNPLPIAQQDSQAVSGIQAVPDSPATAAAQPEAPAKSGSQAKQPDAGQAASAPASAGTPGQDTISDAQAVVAAQIEAAARKLDAGPPPEDTAASAAPTDGTPSNAPADTQNAEPDPSSIGEAIDLDAPADPADQQSQYEPADPYTANPYAPQPHPAPRRKRGSKRLAAAVTIISIILSLVVGFGAFSVWYVKNRVYPSVAYTNYQSVSVKGATADGGFVIEVPTEYSQDHKTDSSIEYSHRVPGEKGSGNYSGVAVNASEITGEDQLGEISKLKEALRDKNSAVSQQFVSLINDSLSGQQNVSLENFIEKTNTSGQEFFGYEIALKQDASSVGKGWMLITASDKYIHVLVVYGTNQVWDDNLDTWQYMFDSLQIASNE